MKILIVEDNEKLTHSITRGLKQEGYAVDSVFDGETAESRLDLYGSDYDLVILDLMLPGESGFDVCRNMRKKAMTTPILVLTARDTTADKVAALDSGADDYLTKPFSFDELSARIRAILRRPSESALPATLTIGNLELNPGTREVFSDAKRISLTLKEFSLLEYLMRNPETIVNREKLYTALWDFNDNSLSNVVDVHVKNLRKKLDESNCGPRIETIRGVGYRLTA